ncbi:hypothetical protein SS1G_05443 [Sclerotinia sclerotiorum 1980 UF-70]|uniref:Uncharacterized protein n=1 Tax=Sclerotinia sclerotiorum (strain ATCC 18683 / 1980 / Ss-1) TaxID=665079 RepID=A7EJF0_SCLS1|nr:hypothetical protein SS1G_05443 [Sclerotinia sclerotiorum 1980 UF-70]EDO02966.1 hypothetical protein SS1G_05443 [Sclerotinia sclerotiorum 1980 UF-70]
MSSSKEPEPEPTFQLFTSLRYDPILLQSPLNIESWPLPSPAPCPFYMLPYHRDRLQQAATHFSWPIAINAISGSGGIPKPSHHPLQKLSIPAPPPPYEYESFSITREI